MRVKLGKTRAGLLDIDLEKAPHLLVGGCTGSGKSVIMNGIICSLIEESRGENVIAIIDVKRVELTPYNIQGFSVGCATDSKQAIQLLNSLLKLIEKRYKTLERLQKSGQIVRTWTPTPESPNVYLFIDELADIILEEGARFVKPLSRVLQIGRAAGVHVICATQRPDAKTIPGLIRANIPARIALKTSTASDSRIILGTAGAERLECPGQAIYKAGNALDLVPFQARYITDQYVQDFIYKMKAA